MERNIFERVEKKYLMTREQKQALLRKINRYLKKDAFFQSTICNVYFDTDHYDLIVNSLDRPIFKMKVRLRSYDVPKLQDHVYLEVKDKYKGVSFKRRVKMKLKDFYAYYNDQEIKDNQVMKEIDYCMQYYHLKPVVFIAYDRVSYQGKKESDLRVTFDSRLRSRMDHLRLDFGDDGELYFDEDYYIMEVKTLGAMPLWFAKALSELRIYPTTFSKYGSVYKNKIRRLDHVI